MDREQALEGTAQEVPVQEQSISSTLKINLKLNGLDVFKDMNPEDSLTINTKSTGRTNIEINLLKA